MPETIEKVRCPVCGKSFSLWEPEIDVEPVEVPPPNLTVPQDFNFTSEPSSGPRHARRERHSVGAVLIGTAVVGMLVLIAGILVYWQHRENKIAGMHEDIRALLARGQQLEKGMDELRELRKKLDAFGAFDGTDAQARAQIDRAMREFIGEKVSVEFKITELQKRIKSHR